MLEEIRAAEIKAGALLTSARSTIISIIIIYWYFLFAGELFFDEIGADTFNRSH